MKIQLNGEERDLLLGAMDTFAILLETYQHEWTPGERAIYEEACRLLGDPLQKRFQAPKK